MLRYYNLGRNCYIYTFYMLYIQYVFLFHTTGYIYVTAQGVRYRIVRGSGKFIGYGLVKDKDIQ